MFIAKVAALIQFSWNGQNQKEKREMGSYEDTGLSITQERYGMVSSLAIFFNLEDYKSIKIICKILIQCMDI